MSDANYESKWWGLIYDQMMAQDLADVLDSHLRFYRSNLQSVNGRILECACGTGLILLPLLAAGHDIYGFDISQSMLTTLQTKAHAQGFSDIESRISVQDFAQFRYDNLFEAIIIPTNTFGMLTTQEAQIRTLQNIYAHLAPQGKLLLDLRLEGVRGLAEQAKAGEGSWHSWLHPETGRPIKQRMSGRYDFNKTMIIDTCVIEYEGETEQFPMSGRWIFRDEFQLLLRLAGFTHWDVFSTPDRAPLQPGLEDTQSYWIAYKR